MSHDHYHIPGSLKGVHVAQWAKRPSLKLEVTGSNTRGWFNGRAWDRNPYAGWKQRGGCYPSD